MVEILSAAPDVIEIDTQFEDDWCAEQLSFPKLDGVLFPLVVANADVIAPCSWMGGTEVSLATALNNYYQTMTEENADEVIADAYEFLANRVDTAREDDAKVEVGEPLVQPAENLVDENPVTVPMQQDDSMEHSDAPIKRSVPVEQEPSKNDGQTLSPPAKTLPKEPVESKARVIKSNEPERNNRTSLEAVDENLVAPSEHESTRLQDIIDSSFDLIVDAPAPLVEEYQEVEPGSGDSPELSRAVEGGGQVADESASIQESFREQYDETKSEPDAFDDDVIPELDEGQETSDVYAVLEAQEADESESLSGVDTAHEEIDVLLTDHALQSESSEPDQPEASNEPADAATGDTPISEGEGVSSDDEGDVQVEPQTLQSISFDAVALADKPKYTKRFSRSSGERAHVDDEWEDGKTQAVARRKSGGRSTAVTTINNALNRVAAIGRLALRLHIAGSIDVFVFR